MQQGTDSAPLVGVTACLERRPGGSSFHQVGAKYVDGVMDGAGALPVLIPAIGPRLDLDRLLRTLDGLLLTGSPSNLEPHHYQGPAPLAGDLNDPERDATVLPLVRRALALAVPVFAICRGIQELNVALGGTLHQEVHRLPERLDHRADKTRPHDDRYLPAHEVEVVPGGELAALLDGARRIEVNSLHMQAIDRLADRLAVEAWAADGTIEAVRVVDAPAFALGVQWHPEWRVLDNAVSRRLFAAFGVACRARARQKARHDGNRILAAGT